MILGALLLGSLAIVFQLVVGALFADKPLWDTSQFLLMALVGFAGGYFDTRREERNKG